MDDRNTMENLLQTTKGACDFYLHAAIEASTPQVRGAFCCALNDTLAIQDSIYNDMAARGWYTTEQAESAKVQQLKQKYCC